jgi:4-amino-4-deoxy-L-arabinose transferase-like glycosyltransferase
MSRWKFAQRPILHASVLVLLCGILYAPYLGSIPLFDKGEPREALAVQDIIQRGEWLVPLKRATDVPSKPPLFHWSAALVTRLTGSFTEATIRFPSALYATLGVLLVFWLGSLVFNLQVAFLGAAILATTMVYQDQALSARVDMTLCFFIILDLFLFYALYSGRLKHPSWYYLFYSVVGIGTLAKGPIGLVLPGLVAGSYAVVERRWDMIKKFSLHPGVALTVILAAGWYVIAVFRGGEGFFDRQILEENLSRFVGGSGHSHPVYYYLSYLITQGLPWSLFFPLLLWDVIRNFRQGGDALFLKLWILVMLGFLSLSAGKRPVYLLPVYPALSLLLAAWFHSAPLPVNGRLAFYRVIAVFAAISGAVLFAITLGSYSNQDGGWFFSAVEALLRPKDRANVIAVKTQLDNFGWRFSLLALSAAGLWLFLARAAWQGHTRTVARQLLAISIIHGTVAWSVVMPVIAEAKSYRDFVNEVNERVGPNDKLFLYGGFHRSPIAFYRGTAVEQLLQPPEELATKLGTGDAFVIMPERTLKKLQKAGANTAPVLLRSHGSGPEGDAPLVLLQADLP